MSINGKPPELKATSATEWRKMREEGVVVPLTSGMQPLLIPVGIEELVRKGRIPDDLSPLAAEIVWKNTPGVEHIRAVGKRSIDMLNTIVQAAFKYPRIIIDEKPEEQFAENEISIDDVSLTDKLEVFMFVTGPAQALRNFRAIQEQSMGNVPAGDQNSPPTQ